MSTYKATRFLTRLLLVVALVSVGVARAFAAPSTVDSEQINKLLNDAKAEAVELRDDAQQMESFTRSGAAWQSHAQQISLIKDHVNKCSELVQKLNEAKGEGSPWQRTAVERIAPLLNELAQNVEGTINHLNENQNRVHMQPFRDYVTANSDLATQLSALIDDFVNYGRTKDKFESIGQRLEVAER